MSGKKYVDPRLRSWKGKIYDTGGPGEASESTRKKPARPRALPAIIALRTISKRRARH